jgi:hypothetical protein
MFLLLPMLWIEVHAARFAKRVCRTDRGQATAEYALVLLGAAAVAVLLMAWATKSHAVENLLEKVFKTVTNKIR